MWQRARIVSVGTAGDSQLLHAEPWVTGEPFSTNTACVECDSNHHVHKADNERVMHMHTVAPSGKQMVVPLECIELLARNGNDFSESMDLIPYTDWLNSIGGTQCKLAQ